MNYFMKEGHHSKLRHGSPKKEETNCLIILFIYQLLKLEKIQKRKSFFISKTCQRLAQLHPSKDIPDRVSKLEKSKRNKAEKIGLRIGYTRG